MHLSCSKFTNCVWEQLGRDRQRETLQVYDIIEVRGNQNLTSFSSILSIFSVTLSVEYGIVLCEPCPCWIWKATCTMGPHCVALMHGVILSPWVWAGLVIAPQTVTVSVQRFKQRKVWCSSVSPSLVLSLALLDGNKTLSSELPYRGSGVKELRDAFSLLATMGGSLEVVFSSIAFMWCQL